MKTTLKLFISSFGIITLIIGCNFGGWVISPNPNAGDKYIPDSLRFKQNTGDTAIFIIKTNSSNILDTFLIENYSEMRATIEDNKCIGSYEIENIKYISKKNIILTFSISYGITNKIFFKYIDDSTTCNTSINDTIYPFLILEEKKYNEVFYSHSFCHNNVANIYINKFNGLLSFTANDSSTYNLYKYIFQ